MDYLINTLGPIAVTLAAILGWLFTHRKKLAVIAELAERSFWIVEELAIATGMSTEEKIEAFKIEFSTFMKNSFYWVTEKNIAIALKLASGLAAKYRTRAETKDKIKKNQEAK